MKVGPRRETEREIPRAAETSGRAFSDGGHYSSPDSSQPVERPASVRPERADARPAISHEVVEAKDHAPKAAAPSELRLKLDLPEAEPVHVRFVERGGEVHVLVRSDQPGASTRLASGLDEFHRSVEARGSQAETWLEAPAEDERLEYSASDETGRTANRGSSNGQQRGGRATPDWLELLSEREDETALRRFQDGRTTWHQ